MHRDASPSLAGLHSLSRLSKTWGAQLSQQSLRGCPGLAPFDKPKALVPCKEPSQESAWPISLATQASISPETASPSLPLKKSPTRRSESVGERAPAAWFLGQRAQRAPRCVSGEPERWGSSDEARDPQKHPRYPSAASRPRCAPPRPRRCPRSRGESGPVLRCSCFLSRPAV